MDGQVHHISFGCCNIFAIKACRYVYSRNKKHFFGSFHMNLYLVLLMFSLLGDVDHVDSMLHLLCFLPFMQL